eukprot:5145298-Alexandrium_andersonii.AAC.1
MRDARRGAGATLPKGECGVSPQASPRPGAVTSVAPEAGPCPGADSQRRAGGGPSPRAKVALRHRHP